MKKCSYCGRENPDEAPQCSGCGMQEFSVGTPPQISAQERRSGRNKILLRLLTAGCVWVAVSGISLYVAWQQANHSMAWFEQRVTQGKLEHIGQALTAYQKIFDSSPSSMDQLGMMTNEVPSIESDLDGNADGWKRPFMLSGAGTDMQFISYGSDGKLGGEGINCDLTSKNPRPKESLPTFDQFLHGQRVQGMIKSSIVCGALAALLSLLTVRIPDFSRRGMTILALSLGATLIGALFIATTITAVHVPSGH